MGNLASSLKYLKDNRVKKGDSVESAARSERMNALTDAILSLARGEHMRKGVGIRLKTSEGVVIISGSPAGEDGGGSDTLPFTVTDVSDAGGPRIAVSPGVIETVKAAIGDGPPVFLDDTPAPSYGVTTGSLYLKIFLRPRSTTVNDWRTTIDKVRVEGFPTEQAELLITWTDLSVGEGYFYLKLADVVVAGASITRITQYLNQSVRSLAIAGDTIILIS